MAGGNKVVVWGASGHARVVADIVRLCGEYEIVGFLDDVDQARHGTDFCGAPVLGGREQLDGLREEGVDHVICGVGDNRARVALAKIARAKGFRFVTAVHPRATIASDVHVGAGSVVAAGAVINPAASIGEHVIINTCASVDHDCTAGDGTHIGPGARLGGGVTVERGAWLGIGAVVKDHVVIGAHAVIGAGSVVIADIPALAVAYGVPATVRGVATDAEW
jgi:sugar O-acyltransferase (sialic acid O-acetyltransferase NeuD family)